MPEKNVLEILFDPGNMALTLLFGILFGIFSGFVTILTRNSQYFYYNLILSAIAFLSLYSILIQYNIDNGMKFKNRLLQIKKFFKKIYEEKTIFPLFSQDDWIELILTLFVVIILAYIFVKIYSVYTEESLLLFNSTLSSSDRQALENARTFFGSLSALIVAVWLFFFNQLLSISKNARNLRNFQNLHKKLDNIIEKLERIEKK